MKIKKQTKGGVKKKPVSNSDIIGRKHYFFLCLILALTFISYYPVFQNGFVWNDIPYVRDNAMVHSFNLKNIFSDYEMGNYHPLTILAFAFEYHLFGLNTTGFHFVNLLFHLLNTVLVFYVFLILIGVPNLALIVALLFGIHPMHVESVAWISEINDLLYAFFFLGSYIYYLKYIQSSKKLFYILSLVLFIASSLSKTMAVCLPIVLILTDYFKAIELKNDYALAYFRRGISEINSGKKMQGPVICKLH